MSLPPFFSYRPLLFRYPAILNKLPGGVGVAAAEHVSVLFAWTEFGNWSPEWLLTWYVSRHYRRCWTIPSCGPVWVCRQGRLGSGQLHPILAKKLKCYYLKYQVLKVTKSINPKKFILCVGHLLKCFSSSRLRRRRYASLPCRRSRSASLTWWQTLGPPGFR